VEAYNETEKKKKKKEKVKRRHAQDNSGGKNLRKAQ
jgi:hypothetical protein